MKKQGLIFLCLLLMMGMLSSCGVRIANTSNQQTRMTANQNVNEPDSKKLNIVTTIFPEYDWVRQILGQRLPDTECLLLLDNGVDLHSYQPTIDDIIRISECDLLIYVGGESDNWIEDALKEADNPHRTVIKLLDVLGEAAKQEEIVEGMQQTGDSGQDSEEEIEYDEHVWLSLRNAKIFCQTIAEALEHIDPIHQEIYANNATSYLETLDSLDRAYQELSSHAPVKTVLFGDRFPFRYLTDDYGWNYYAAFAGCSAETEASFETIIFLANQIDRLGLSHILILENSDGKLARTIAENTAAKTAQILPINSLQSITSQDIKNGTTYLGVMESNLDILKQALQ